MNEYSKELCHWALGKKAKDHKYIAREDGKQKGKYIYFYDIYKETQKTGRTDEGKERSR